MIERIADIFTGDFKHWFKIEMFRRALYLFILLNTITLLPAATELWSYPGMSGTRWDFSLPIWRQVGSALTNILSHPRNADVPWLYLLFIAGQIIFLITGILRVIPRFSALAIYFFTVNLNMKGALMFTGGEVLINLVLFYLIFIQADRTNSSFKIRWRINRDESVTFSSLQNVVNNSFYWILLIQICILYFFSTFYKLLDPNWTSGNALMYISQIAAYSSNTMRFLFSESPLIAAVATYAVLFYQGLFPVFVWIRRIKIPFLIFGVLMHLSIAFGMGIFTFGVVMCLVYLPFLEDEHLLKLRDIFRRRTKN